MILEFWCGLYSLSWVKDFNVDDAGHRRMGRMLGYHQEWLGLTGRMGNSRKHREFHTTSEGQSQQPTWWGVLYMPMAQAFQSRKSWCNGHVSDQGPGRIEHWNISPHDGGSLIFRGFPLAVFLGAPNVLLWTFGPINLHDLQLVLSHNGKWNVLLAQFPTWWRYEAFHFIYNRIFHDFPL